MTTVSNSSPLIALARIDLLTVLPSLFQEILVPEAVWHEVVIRGVGKPGGEALIKATHVGWLRQHAIEDQLAASTLRSTLGAGEAEAIILAHKLSASWVLLDDDLGRTQAHRLGLSVKGTVGVLVAAHQAGLIDDLKRVVDDLRADGFWLSDNLYRAILSVSSER